LDALVNAQEAIDDDYEKAGLCRQRNRISTLRGLTPGFYCWTHISDLFNGIYVGTYLWKDTLDKPKMKALYKIMFTYTMM
jgi:hypothetical protein